ncbi:MAG: hypothetical protein LQ344_003947 [Seirophora lacunosa]|nr:MAG: hypothetical protein LQ344_003947 [Seirophora lacunosa]
MAPWRNNAIKGGHRAIQLHLREAQRTDARPYRTEDHDSDARRQQQRQQKEEQEARVGIDERPSHGPSRNYSGEDFSTTFPRHHFHNHRLPDGQEPLLEADMLRPSTETALDPFTALQAQCDEYRTNINRHLNDIVAAEDRARILESRLVNLRDEINDLTRALNQAVTERDALVLQVRGLRDTNFAQAERLQLSENGSQRRTSNPGATPVNYSPDEGEPAPPPTSPLPPLSQPRRQRRLQGIRLRSTSRTSNAMYDVTTPPAPSPPVAAPQRRRQQPVRVCKSKVRSDK